MPPTDPDYCPICEGSCKFPRRKAARPVAPEIVEVRPLYSLDYCRIDDVVNLTLAVDRDVIACLDAIRRDVIDALDRMLTSTSISGSIRISR